MTQSSSQLLAFLLILSSTLLPAHSGRCDKNDKKTLLNIKASFGNPPALASWSTSTSCCSWPGISCDDVTGRIRNLTISSASLSGPIPASIGDLTTLFYLTLRSIPGLTGPIPNSLSTISNLYQLTISGTGLSGPIPAFLGDCKQIGLIDLSDNRLSGQIPDSLVKLPSLFELDLGGNELTGTLSSSLFLGYTNNPTLNLSNNLLTGVVPPAYGNVDFDVLDLSNNGFSGDASFLLNNQSKRASWIDLSRNEFQFDMSRLELPKERLELLNLSHNNISGSIPESVVSLERLEVLDLSYNMLCGRIPTGGPMARFSPSSYEHNKCLCGAPLPACVSHA